jgi:hypothetical protein
VLPLKLFFIRMLCSRFLCREGGRGAFDVICKEERTNLLTATTDYGLSSLTMGIGSEVQNYNININIYNIFVHNFVCYYIILGYNSVTCFGQTAGPSSS